MMNKKISLEMLKVVLLPKEMRNVLGGSSLCRMICGGLEIMIPHGNLTQCVEAAYKNCSDPTNGYSCPGCDWNGK